jgi:hypothetical protein
MIDKSKIKLIYKDRQGTGKEIWAETNQEYDCVEFVKRDDHPQPITWHPKESFYLFSEPFIQFAPKEWRELIDTVFSEMVELWNEKYSKEENDG